MLFNSSNIRSRPLVRVGDASLCASLTLTSSEFEHSRLMLDCLLLLSAQDIELYSKIVGWTGGAVDERTLLQLVECVGSI